MLRAISIRFRCGRQAERGGFTITELIVSMVLLGTVFATVVPTVRWIGHEQRTAQHRRMALIEAANLMDHLSAQPWEGVNDEFAAGLVLSDEAKQHLPNARLNVSIHDSESESNARRVSVSLSWQEREGVPAAPVQVTTWVYRRGRPDR